MPTGPRALRSLVLSVALGLIGGASAAPSEPPPRPTVLTIGGPVTSRSIAAGFVGLSFEYFAVPAYAGSDPSRIDGVFVQLIHNLAGGHPPVLRIGGNTTDTSWWPVPRMAKPTWVIFTLTRRWIGVTRALAARLRAKLILGINFEADSTRVAAVEARALLAGIGRRRVEALELGNEPELYDLFTWGRSGVRGRPKGYSFAAFDKDFTRIARALPRVPLAGPAQGAYSWFRYLGRFLSDHPRVSIATLHRYPLQLCYASPTQPDYPTIANLLAPYSSRYQALSIANAVRVAHAHGDSLRIDEMNTISCGSVPAVAQSFASALWAINALFQMARVGVDGVNIHTFPGPDSLFSFRRIGSLWSGVVEPEYYGLEMFAQAAPAGSRLLKVSPTGAPQLKAWATRARDRTIRVLVINDGATAQGVTVRAAGTRATGTLERLEAPSITADQGVTLAGQGFGTSTTTGLLAGPRRTSAVARKAGVYAFGVAGGSAAMLTLQPS
jgi:hypothetical protein